MTEPDDVLRGHIRIPEHVVFRQFEDETVLLNLHTGTYHGLNATGGRFLELARETGSLMTAAQQIAAEDNHPVDDVVRDMIELCRGLAVRDLIEIDDAPPG